VSVRPIAFAAVAALVLAAGCGRAGSDDLVTGKTLFVQKCGACHTLARANTKGVQGPNLDNAFAQARRDGMTDQTVEGIVYGQIENVRRGSIMPPNLVTGSDRRDVAAYVGRSAAVAGEDAGQLAEAGGNPNANKTAKESGGKLSLDADPTGALAFSAGKAIATAGSLQLVMRNPSSLQHDIAVQGNGVNQKGPVVGKGGTSTVRVTLRAGNYTFLCTVPGHAAGGMKGTLTVR
jgi:mono/diheme cytochrome c family protein